MLYDDLEHEAIESCPTTLNLLFLQSFFDITNGRYKVDMHAAIDLATLLLQGHFGDYTPEKAANVLPLCGGEDEAKAAATVCSRYLPRAHGSRLVRSAAKQQRKTRKGGGAGSGGPPKTVQVGAAILNSWSNLGTSEDAPHTPGEVKVRYVEMVGGLPLYGADLYHADMLVDENAAGGSSQNDLSGKKKKKKGKNKTKDKGAHHFVVVVVNGHGVEVRDPVRIFAKKALTVIPYSQMLSWGNLHGHDDVVRNHDIGLTATSPPLYTMSEYRFHTKHSKAILSRIDAYVNQLSVTLEHPRCV